jgi:DNA-binding NarL/FixJ family response regulator
MKRLENINVLIVDDDPLVCEMIQGVVEDIGYHIAGRAINGQEAINLTKALTPDVVIMDINMPGMNGIEASQALYDCCAAPVVVLTAYESQELIEQVTLAGAGAYLVKPPNRSELERAITVAIARFNDLQTLKLLNNQLLAKNQRLEATLNRIKQLSGLLPICMHCKRIRTDAGYWQEVELFIREHSEADFSHSLCPDCIEKYYPDFARHQR